LEFINVNNGAQPLQFVFAPIPTNGPDAVVQGQWYHLAAAYTGDANTPDNSRCTGRSWTGARTQATLVVSAADDERPVAGDVDFSIGNVGRGTPNGNFIGLLDEVRISNVARAADQMLFGVSSVPPSFALHRATSSQPQATTSR